MYMNELEIEIKHCTSFGSVIPGRSWSEPSLSAAYRMGFNGKEKIDEIEGDGNAYDFGARILDTRLGRWLCVDPQSAKYPSLSPYNFVGNNPNCFIDPNGEEIIIAFYRMGEVVMDNPNKLGQTILVTQEVQVAKITYKDGKLLNDKGEEVKLSTITDKEARKYIGKVVKNLNKINKAKTKDTEVASVFDDVQNSKTEKTMIRNRKKGMTGDETSNDSYHNEDGYNSTIFHDPDATADNRGNKRKSASSLGHEIKHAYNYAHKKITGGETTVIDPNAKGPDGENIEFGKIKNEEINAVNFENRVRTILGEKYVRTKFSGLKIPEDKLNPKPDSKKVNKNEN